MLKRIPFYPLLCCLYPIVALTAYNIDEISLKVVLRPLVVTLLACILLFGLAKLLLRDWHRAALAVLTLVFIFFVYGHVYNLLEDVTIGNVSIFRHRTLLPFMSILLLVLWYLIAFRLKRPAGWTLWVNLLGIYLLIYPTSKIALSVFQQGSADRVAQAAKAEVVVDKNQPDVYYIILDAYGREDVLRNMFGYDNQEFVDALRQRGFYVADCSQTNYGYTNFSLTSSLNYEYLDVLNVSGSRVERTALLKHSALRGFFEENGYQTVAFPTGWAFTEWDDADFYLDFDRPVSTLDEFETLILNTTPLRIVEDLKIVNTSDTTGKDIRRLRVLSALDKLKQLPGIDDNLFVFAHIVVPHRPYTFGPNGEIPAYDGKTATYEQTANAYLDQVTFISNEILKVVDALLEDSKNPPVIIIQGDHGPSADLTNNAAERMPILNAYYLPGIDMDTVLYPTISPVNSFRVVLNTYFDQDLPILEDRSYYAPEEGRTDFELVPNSCAGQP
jgi:hypothetical protein